jgi:F0F1-type ATP synthase membrane subunit c/vacuolar-type H+-ATPase subunit K
MSTPALADGPTAVATILSAGAVVGLIGGVLTALRGWRLVWGLLGTWLALALGADLFLIAVMKDPGLLQGAFVKLLAAAVFTAAAGLVPLVVAFLAAWGITRRLRRGRIPKESTAP